MLILGNPDDVADEFGRSALYFKLGYFSLIGLLRTHVLLGDYHQALKTVENLELDSKVLSAYPFVMLQKNNINRYGNTNSGYNLEHCQTRQYLLHLFLVMAFIREMASFLTKNFSLIVFIVSHSIQKF